MRRIPHNVRLVALAFVLLAIYAAGGRMSPEEDRLWEKVRAAHKRLWETQMKADVPLSSLDDKTRSGLIGVEWSSMTTTLGGIEAKRTACNPLWTARFLEWFDELGIERGDRVVIYSSSSFPGMLLSALVACESRELDVLLSVSMGSSTWGANRPEFPWSAMSAALRDAGLIRTRAEFYTLGGVGDRGGEFSEETISRLAQMAAEDSTRLYVPATLAESIAYKSGRLGDFGPKLFISIGGGAANFGDSEAGPEIPNGLVMPDSISGEAVGGVIGQALSSGVPVLNILNIRLLARESGIPWDPDAFVKRTRQPGLLAAVAGIVVFCGVLRAHRRWTWDDETPHA